APAYNKVTDLGAIQYIMNYNGASSTVNSAGRVYVAPEDKNIVVSVNQAAALTYDSNASNANFKETLKFGATDYVVGLSEYAYQQTEDVFKISTGWIPKQCVKVLPKITNCFNDVSNVRFEKEGRGEQLILTGTAQSDYQVTQTPEAITFTLYNTSGFNSASVNGSSIFSGVTVTPGDKTTKITLDKKSSNSLWGYTVEYKNNDTILYFKKKPTLSGNNSTPLKGITIALDAGHGGNDSGAVGVSGGASSTEDDLTLAAVLATSKRLESLGAKVIIPRKTDTAMTMDERMNISEAAKADFFISMHYNSIATGVNASSARGIEVYYYQNEAKNFASNMATNVSSSTGRNNRGAKFSNYRVTLNTYAPSLLIELGFICNPIEYDNICNPDNLYHTANGVADAIIATLK
ncbi:MAG: N-acetylmuramoyl-L-alanine amidase, partial [Oscillospiraceae bacterium]